MTPETLEALKGSIEKWRKIVEEHGIDNGPSNCPLCSLFHWCGCVGCPISEATEEDGCFDTPYIEWCEAGGGWSTANTPRKIAAARAELEFLRSLLPKEETQES